MTALPRTTATGLPRLAYSVAEVAAYLGLTLRQVEALLLFPWVLPGGAARPLRAALRAGHGLPFTSRGAPGQHN